MKLKCAILDDYQNIALSIADWSSLREKIEIKSFQEHFEQEDDLVHTIENYEIIIVMRERTPFKASLFSRLPKLQLLITSGMRNASIDLHAAEACGVKVCGTKSFSEPPAELTWALILGLARNIVVESNALRNNGPWQSSMGVGLSGKTLGLLGLGKIGSLVAKIGLAFGMKVVAWSQNLTAARAAEIGVNLAATKDELLENSDFVSIHLVLSDRTRHLLKESDLKRMKPTAFLINTSRAQIVDQAALITALESRWIAGAGIDVFEVEPLPSSDKLRSLPNILATPHLGYVADRNYQTYFREAVEDIEAFLKGALIRELLIEKKN